jgi:hypothetical protein
VTLAVETDAGWDTVGTALATPARLLSPEPCAPCLFSSVWDDRHAVVTRQDLTGSYLIDADGSVTDAPRWPAPILGESRWGNDGGAFAWSSRPGRVLVRDAEGAIAHDVALPFTPTSAEADGDAIRFTALDGVWRWMPQRGAEHVVDTAALVYAREADGRLDLAPVPPPSDRPQRRRTRRVLAWSPSEGLHEHDPPPLGPCWSGSTRNGWTAEALPDANLVRVSDESGVRGWVICDYPRAVAWAGGSLVVVSTGGFVLFVPGVHEPLA